MEKMVKPPVPEAFLVNSGALFLSVCILFPVAGSLSDRIGRKRMMYIGCLFLACLCPFMVIFIAEGSNSVLIGNSSTNAFIAQFIMGIFLSCFGAPSKYTHIQNYAPWKQIYGTRTKFVL